MCACPAGAEETIPAIFQGCKIRPDIGVMAIVVGDPTGLCDQAISFGPNRTTKALPACGFDVGPILAKLVVFSPNDLFDDRLCDLIPMLRPAAVANADRDFGTTKDIALIGPLAETDRLIASGDAATLAKIAALHVVCVGHGPHRS